MVTNLVEGVGVYVPDGGHVMLATTADTHGILTVLVLFALAVGAAVLVLACAVHRMASTLAELEERICDIQLGNELKEL